MHEGPRPTRFGQRAISCGSPRPRPWSHLLQCHSGPQIMPDSSRLAEFEPGPKESRSFRKSNRRVKKPTTAQKLSGALGLTSSSKMGQGAASDVETAEKLRRNQPFGSIPFPSTTTAIGHEKLAGRPAIARRHQLRPDGGRILGLASPGGCWVQPLGWRREVGGARRTRLGHCSSRPFFFLSCRS